MKRKIITEDFFERTAKLFRSDAILIPGGTRLRNRLLDKVMKKQLIPILTKLENESVLEIGCGVGRWCSINSKQNSVIGVDIARSMVFEARKNKKNEKVTFLIADASRLPFKDNSFDCVISITVLQHILDQKKLSDAISEICRCSKKHIIIVEEMWSKTPFILDAIHYPIRIASIYFYKKELKSNGFIIDMIKGLTFAPLSILLVRVFMLMLERMNIRLIKTSELSSKKSGFGLKILDIILGLTLLSSFISSSKGFSSKLSLHTLLNVKTLKMVDGSKR